MDIFPEIGPRKQFLVLPKFGARSPPMPLTPIFLIPNHSATPSSASLEGVPSSKSAEISGGGSAFLVREPAIVLNSSRHTFKSFECSSITLQLASYILTVFNIYRPPTSSNYSQKSSVFLHEFASLLSLAATTPNEFVLVGDFNVHVDTPSDTLPPSFLNLLSSVTLVQHVNFPTHIENHTLDLLITSTASLLSPKVSRSAFNITDHFLIMADLEIKPFVRPPPPTHSFRLTGSIDRPAFIKNILDSQLILNPPSSLEDLLSCYNSTLSNLLNIHAPLITKQSSHANNLWFTSYIQAFKSFRRHLEHVYKRTIDPASRAEALTNLKSATHRYHKLVIAAKQKYTSFLLFTPALPTLDIFGEQLTLFFIANLPLHSLPPFHPPLSLTHSAHFSQTKFHPFASHYSLF